MFARDAKILRRIVPPHMIIVGCQELRKIDGQLRPDMVQKLEIEITNAMKDLDTLSISRLAKRCDEAVMSMLHDTAPEAPTDIVLAACFFILRLVDEGFSEDPGAQSTLFALAIKEEAEENQKYWRYSEANIKQMVDKFMQRAKMLAIIN